MKHHVVTYLKKNKIVKESGHKDIPFHKAHLQFSKIYFFIVTLKRILLKNTAICFTTTVTT